MVTLAITKQELKYFRHACILTGTEIVSEKETGSHIKVEIKATQRPIENVLYDLGCLTTIKSINASYHKLQEIEVLTWDEETRLLEAISEKPINK
jgi:hypothetical protein